MKTIATNTVSKTQEHLRPYTRPSARYLPKVSELTRLFVEVLWLWRRHNAEYCDLINDIDKLLNEYIKPGEEEVRDYIVCLFATKQYDEENGGAAFGRAIRNISKLEHEKGSSKNKKA